MTERTLCVGEALVDVVLRDGSDPVEHVGGSLFNVARGLAALGTPTALLSWWGHDPRGARIAAAAAAADLAVLPGTDGAPSTPIAYARLDGHGHATYEFDLTWHVPTVETAPFGHLHTGSFAATLPPGADGVHALAARLRGHGTVSYDPNVRPALMGTPDAVRAPIERMVALADVVKASDEDLAWLYPGSSPASVLQRWLTLGPALVVLTRGADGADALTSAFSLHLDPPTVTVADTVGAGDSFMAGLLSGLSEAGLLGSRAAAAALRRATAEQIRPALARAIATSSITVQRAGAYAPSMHEVRKRSPTQGSRLSVGE